MSSKNLFKRPNIKKFKAFTLAEVLISLGVIGIIAALTIPAIIINIQNAELKSKFKKEFSIFSQAFLDMQKDNGGTLAGVFQGNLTSFQTNFQKYLNATDFASSSNSSTNISWEDSCDFKYLNGTYQGGTYDCNACPTGRLADGTMFIVLVSWATHDLSTCTISGSYPRADLCFDIFMDVNGKTAPNTMGKDIYAISVYKNKVVPIDWFHGTGAVDSSDCTTSGAGIGCSTKVVLDQGY